MKIAVIAGSWDEFFKTLNTKPARNRGRYVFLIGKDSQCPFDSLEVWGTGALRDDYEELVASVGLTPVTSESPEALTIQQWLLLQIIQEASEVTQAITKGMMFSMGDHHPKNPESNEVLIRQELADLFGSLMTLKDNGLDLFTYWDDLAEAKTKKIAKYLRYAETSGMIRGRDDSTD